jgi:hypothetical protein
MSNKLAQSEASITNEEKVEFEGEETLGVEHREKSGIEEPEPVNIYPDATVNIVPENASVFQMKRKYDKKPSLIKLDPDFQRHKVWTPKQQSELIESILMGIPLPLIYVKEDDKGVYIIVDGRQRLTTLFSFMNHEFPLQKLTVLTDLNGSYFSETALKDHKGVKVLSQAQQSKIEDCPLTLHVIKPPTQDRVTFDLFDRVNRGGTRLNNQEMRNAIYQGAATKLLNKLVAYESFKSATENSIKPDRMKDKYLILRLIAFFLWRNKILVSVKEKESPLVEYRSDLEDFLSKTMLFLNDIRGASFCAEFPNLFDKTMRTSVNVIGTGCFRVPSKGDGPRRPINMALFESCSFLILSMLDIAENKKQIIKDKFLPLLKENDDYYKNITSTVDSTTSVTYRFKKMEELIEEIKNA